MAKKLLGFLLLLGSGFAGILSHNTLLSISGTVVTGAMFAHGVELTHQFLHGSGFRGRAGNHVAGFLCAAPMLVSHSHYRALHLAHHRDLGTPANAEFFSYGEVRGRPFLVVLARSFSLARYPRIVRNIFRALIGRAPEGELSSQERRVIQLEYIAIFAIIVGAIAFTTITRSSLVLRIWVVPLLLVAEPIHFWIELPEHFGCDLTTRNVLFNTRTIRGSWLSSWFTNGNNFHVEHHLYPRIAIDKLPRIHAALCDDLQFFDRSYWSFLRMALSGKPRLSCCDGAGTTPQPALSPSQPSDRPPVAASTAGAAAISRTGEPT